MFLDVFNEEILLSFTYEISEEMRDYYDNPLEPEPPTEKETQFQTGLEETDADMDMVR